MILRLWALAWVARYLKYVPILGWRFSDTIGEKIETRMDRDIDVSEVAVSFEGEPPPTDLTVEMSITNELPVDLTISAVNLRVGYESDAATAVNLLWSEDAHGPPPKNLSRSLVESETSEILRFERRLPAEPPDDTLHLDGSITTKGLLDVPSTKRLPLGTLVREVPETTVEVPT